MCIFSLTFHTHCGKVQLPKMAVVTLNTVNVTQRPSRGAYLVTTTATFHLPSCNNYEIM